MSERERLSFVQRRTQLVDVGERWFAERPYDEVRMADLAHSAGVSRALLYRHFPSKPDLFAAVYQRAADRLLAVTALDPAVPLTQQVTEGLDLHLDYFVANRHTVLAANRVLVADPAVQAIISDELSVLTARLLNAIDLQGRPHEVTAALLRSWLVFVRVLCVDWLLEEPFSRDQVRDLCAGALFGALSSVSEEPSRPTHPAGSA